MQEGPWSPGGSELGRSKLCPLAAMRDGCIPGCVNKAQPGDGGKGSTPSARHMFDHI